MVNILLFFFFFFAFNAFWFCARSFGRFLLGPILTSNDNSVLGTKRVHNNIVYNEYISHREHIHMNATQWETLTDFTKWLGREGKYCCFGLWHFKTIR